MTAQDLTTGVRASNLVGCVRKAWFDGVQQEREELSKKTRKLFRIRSMQNDALALDDAEDARASGRVVKLEQEIPWGPKTERHTRGMWTAHADYADHTEHEIWEYTGSSDLSPDRRKMLQAAFYAKRMSELTGHEWAAFVKVFDPSTGEDRVVPVNWREIVWEIDVAVADLEAALATMTIPDRVDTQGKTTCKSPHDGPGMFCPYVMACFQGWEYPIPGRLEGELASDVIAAHNLAKRANVSMVEKDLRPLKKGIAARIAPGGKYQAPLDDGSVIEVSYAELPPRVTISLKEMEDAGFKLPDELRPFVKTGEPSVRVTTKLIDAPS